MQAETTSTLWFVVSCSIVLTTSFKVWIKQQITVKTIRMKATGKYFTVVLFIMLYKVVFTFESAEREFWGRG